MYRKIFSAFRVYYCILRFICIIHDTILSIFNICMDLHIIVGAEPAMQILFTSRTPHNTSIKYPAVLKAVWQAANIYRPSFAILIYSHLDFFFMGNQNLRPLVCIYILLSFAKVHIAVTVFQNKMVWMFFPVIFIVI